MEAKLTDYIRIAGLYKHAAYTAPTPDEPEQPPEKKRPKLDLKPAVKGKCLRAMGRFYFAIATDALVDASNIHSSSQIGGLLKTTFHYVRQEALQQTAMVEKLKAKVFVVSGTGGDIHGRVAF